MSFPSESDMMSNELQNSDLIYVNLMTDVFKIIVKYRWKIIAKYRHLSPSGNRALPPPPPPYPPTQKIIISYKKKEM